ncbi:MAG: sigma 54-interacting transcriptional regulator [Burkholderiaceae bacterium]
MTTQRHPEYPVGSTPSASLRGVVVLDAEGRIVLATGIASNRELSARICRAWQMASSRGKQIFAVDVAEQSVVVVAFQSPGGTVLIAAEREGRDPVVEFVGTVDFAGDILREILTNPFEAMTVVDHEGVMRYLSPVHEKFFGISPGSGVGQHVTRVIENTRLHEVVVTGKAEVGAMQQMRGVTRVVSRLPIHDRSGRIVGAIGQVMFKGPEQLQAMSNELSRLRSEVAFYRRELSDLRGRHYGLEHIVGDSAAIQQLKQQIIKVAPLNVPVLLTGESGTGKELAAHAIHMLSARKDHALVMVNAAAMPAALVESELFGYEAGAFTGAERKGRRGKIEQADRGTLFFDEIGDMPAEVQVKLLRVLQDGRYERVGGNASLYSDFRLVSASNRDFEAMIAEGRFRLDLFYRIGGVTIRMPALRERLEDIPQLAEMALQQFAERHGTPLRRLSDEALAFLSTQAWPGNVRQLIHAVERAAIFAEGEQIRPDDFLRGSAEAFVPGAAGSPAASATPPVSVAVAVTAGSDSAGRSTLGEIEPIGKPIGERLDGLRSDVRGAVEQVEEQLIRAAMARCGGNKKAVARELGISRSYLYKRLAQLGL